MPNFPDPLIQSAYVTYLEDGQDTYTRSNLDVLEHSHQLQDAATGNLSALHVQQKGIIYVLTFICTDFQAVTCARRTI